MKRIAAVIAIGLSSWAVAGVWAADVNNHLTLDQSGGRTVGSIFQICAHADRTFINVNNLRWTYHSHLARVKYVLGEPANCRQYRAPAVIGWDRVKVTFVYHGQKFAAYSKFNIIPRP